MGDEIRVPVASDQDIIAARQEGKRLAAQLGFSGSELTLLTTAISEISRNIITYAKEGYMTFQIVSAAGKSGIEVVAEDSGPGIVDINLAMQDGYSSSRSLGLGLPGTKRVMDEFEIESQPGKGTTIRMIKWKKR